VNAETVQQAIEPLAVGLRADGYDVEVGVQGGDVAIRVVAGPEACEECLVPKPLMATILSQALTDAGLSVPPERLALTYPTD
jgi:hypothetical protein